MRIYIAGPYTIGDTAVNIQKTVEAAEEVRRKGHLPYIPHLFHLWHLISPHEKSYWMVMDFEWLQQCNAILRLYGESEGADEEVEFARKNRIPVYNSVDQIPCIGEKII